MNAALPADWQRRLVAAWGHRGWLAWVLWPLSLVFGLLVALRKRLYHAGIFKTHKVNAAVIVVGNVVAGGAGKTPMVIEIVKHLRQRGLQVGVVSRGYGREKPDRSQNQGPGQIDSQVDCLEVLPNSPARQVGDEPALIKHACDVPVFVANRRLDAARALLASYPQTQVVVCDDALQHLALHRDLEICVFDERGVGNGFLQPAGMLREPWPRQPGKHGTPGVCLVLTPFEPAGNNAGNYAGNQEFTTQRRLADYAVRADGSRIPLEELVGQALHAVAAIAQPEAFFAMLRQRGLTLSSTEALPDHYNFSSYTRNIHGNKPLICTEKDAIKLWQAHPGALAVPLVLTIDAGFWLRLDSFLDSLLDSSAEIVP